MSVRLNLVLERLISTSAFTLVIWAIAQMPMNAMAWAQPTVVNQQHSEQLTASETDTPVPVNEILSEIEGKTGVPIFLPSNLPFSSESKIYFSSEAKADSYRVDINFTPDCKGTPCYIGAIEAEKDSEFSTPLGFPRETFKNIELANGTKGIFRNACGAYCTALVEWQHEGVLYRVTMKNGREEVLIKMANSAIEAGER